MPLSGNGNGGSSGDRKAVDGGAIGVRKPVTVGVDCDFDARMPKLFGDIHRAFALHQKQSGVGVTQVMETDTPKLRVIQALFKMPASPTCDA